MGAVITWLLSLVGSVVSWFGIRLATKTLIAATAIAVTITLTAALASVFTAAITGFQSSLSDSWLVAGVGMFLPWNTSLCVSAYISVRLGRWMYDLAVLHVQFASRV